ncbi:MAG: UDP-N-acetylmuramate dehydrogenase [Acidobacteriaceae bacterium]
MTILENVSLAGYTTLGVGGLARWLVEATTEDDVLAAVRFARAQGVPFFILGGGSNLLVSDSGFLGVVIHVAAAGSVWAEESNGYASIVSSAGTDWDRVVQLAVDKNGAGIECLAGIPGSVGGTPVQNVGAYGQEVSHTIASVRAIDLDAEKVVQLAPADCGFSYRSSIFNATRRGRYAITRVVYGLQLDGQPHLEYRDVKQYFAERGTAQPTLAETAAAVREIRARKGMLLDANDPDSRSAGSFFKNPIVPAASVSRLAVIAGCRVDEVPQFPPGAWVAPADELVKISAAWLIERTGFHKGFRMGQAGISTKHTLALVNFGGATAAEVVALRDAVMGAVEKRFAIRLEQEPITLGFAHPH